MMGEILRGEHAVHTSSVLCRAVSLAMLAFACAPSNAAETIDGSVMEMVKVTDRVYAFIGPDPTRDIVVGNSVAIIGDDAVLLVDTTNAPSNGRAVLAGIRKVTDKPVRYIVHTHWHYDHIMGDTVFTKAFGSVQVIAHANTLPILDEKIPAWPARARMVYTKIAGQYRSELAGGKDENGKPLSAYDRARHEQTIADTERYLPELDEMGYVRPAVTFTDAMTVYLGMLEVRLLYVGRGNTTGDVAVYVPAERVLATGDLLVYPIPYAFNSYLDDWQRGLLRLAELDTAAVIPGHGPVFRDKEYLRAVASLLESVVTQANEAKRKGLTLAEAQKAVDLESFRQRFAGDDPSRNDAWTGDFKDPAVASVYDELSAAH
jgi:glyoxylase-like metal-dependent hydrolase (beta-lactamase superfamily II)